jgi:hypothetical protein
VFPSHDSESDSKEFDELVRQLASNPNDDEARRAIQRFGTKDPSKYAELLERIARETEDRTHACYWLYEAAMVQSDKLGDPHYAAELLLQAVMEDATQDPPAEHLTRLYRERDDKRGELALVERRIRLLTPSLATHQDMAEKVAAMHHRAGELWAAPPMSDRRRSREHFESARKLRP